MNTKWIENGHNDGRMDTERTQKGHRMDTEWTQNGHRMDTEWTLNGHWMDTEWTQNGPSQLIATSIYVCLIMALICFALGQDLENDEVLLSLDRDILELQKDNARLETSMIELRSQIGAMESSLRQRVRENKALEENIQHLTKYYEFMKKTNKCWWSGEWQGRQRRQWFLYHLGNKGGCRIGRIIRISSRYSLCNISIIFPMRQPPKYTNTGKETSILSEVTSQTNQTIIIRLVPFWRVV